MGKKGHRHAVRHDKPTKQAAARLETAFARLIWSIKVDLRDFVPFLTNSCSKVAKFWKRSRLHRWDDGASRVK
jgi:hypothetical protein